ncbi:MAG: hypothetical protein R6U32_03570 [Candidatus Woesearchaeota archaeon]
MKRKFLWAMISLLVLFGIISLVAFINLKKGSGILHVMPYYYENLVVILFCLGAGGRVVWEMHKL